MQDFSGLTPFAGYAGVAAVAAAVAAFWRQIQGGFRWAASWFLATATVSDYTGKMLVWHLRQSSREPFRGKIHYDLGHYFIRSKSHWGAVPLEWRSEGKLLLVNGWIPVIISSAMQGGSDGKPVSDVVTVSTIRGLLDIEKAIGAAVAAHNDATASNKDRRRHSVTRLGAVPEKEVSLQSSPSAGTPPIEWRCVGQDKANLGTPIPESPFSHLAYSKEVMDAVAICRRWLASKEQYRLRSLPWRLGMLFTGGPGNGKTSCARAIAQELDLPVFILDLAEMSNSSLVKAWSRVREAAPAMVLLEDIDRVAMAQSDEAVAKRQAKRGGADDDDDVMRMWRPLSLDCLLNCISGIDPAEGILTVATANDEKKLDPALGVPKSNGSSTRPGRLDFRVDFPPPDAEARMAIAVKILGFTPLTTLEKVVRAGARETGAQFTKRCADMALKAYWASDASKAA